MLRKALVLSLAFLFTIVLGAVFLPQANASEYLRISELVKLPASYTVSADGKVETDKKIWTREREEDGTELYTSTKGDARIAVLHDSKGGLESFTTFKLGSAPKGKGDRPETDESLYFKDGKLTARTSCEVKSERDSIGRVCTTATEALCKSVKTKDVITPDALKEMDEREMRSLAVILTLRGPDHQLDNVVRYGNRLGLRDAAQTTKGQLILASRSPASQPSAEEKRQLEGVKAAIDRLKSICSTTGF